MHRAIWLLSVLALSGCISRSQQETESAAEAAQAAAAVARYRARQESERPAPTSEWDLLPLRHTTPTEDGILREPSIEFIRVPHQP